MRWDYDRIDTDEEYAKLWWRARMKRFPQCPRLRQALEAMGYTDIEIDNDPRYIAASTKHGAWIESWPVTLRGVHRHVAFFAQHQDKHPWQGPPTDPRPEIAQARAERRKQRRRWRAAFKAVFPD